MYRFHFASKSTQVPQFLLDDPHIGPTCNIIVTQPRRISAISVAERVASERCEQVGQSVGYSVRLETAASKKTQLMFVTPGVLMKRLHPSDNEIYADGNVQRLSEYTHIIMDEIHERDKNTEFLMIALQDLLEERDDLQLILMSATMPTRDLAEYWCGVGRKRMLEQTERHPSVIPTTYKKTMDDDDWGDDGAAMPAEINIPGRTFPVQEFFLEDVLTMTGFVDDIHGAEAPDMAQIENDLMSLLTAPKTSSKKSNNGKDKAAPTPSTLLQLENTLTCCMCNRSGFHCAEEFGTHVALCDGGGCTSMEDLEDRVRCVDASSFLGFDDAAMTAIEDAEDDVIMEDVEDGMSDIVEEEFEDYVDEDELGLVGGKWNGESPFGVENTGPSTKPTLTEEEMLLRYQTMYDDEEINYELLLELVRYVNKSSYGDGAILVFFRELACVVQLPSSCY